MRILRSFYTALILLLLAFSTRAQEPAKAFPFELKDTLGHIVRLDDFRGKVILMDFWFTGCKGCVQVAKGLHEQVIPHFKDDTSIVFIAVSIDVNFLQWKKSIRTEVYSAPPELNLFTQGMGADHPLFRYYGFSGCPQLLLIDAGGYLVSSSPPMPGPELVKLIQKAKLK